MAVLGQRPRVFRDFLLQHYNKMVNRIAQGFLFMLCLYICLISYAVVNECSTSKTTSITPKVIAHI